jgi:hypothetical protein
MWAADIESKKSIDPVQALSAGSKGQQGGDAAQVVMGSDSKKEL